MGGYAALGQVLGSLIGAGAQIGGAELGQADSSTGSQQSTSFNPWSVPTFAGSQNDAANLIGYGDINNIATPLDQLIGQINGLDISNKDKRRALDAITQIRELEATTFDKRKAKRLSTGSYEPLTAEELEQFEKVRSNLKTISHTKELRGVLSRLGMTEDDFFAELERDTKFKVEQSSFAEQQSGFQADTIKNRFNTATTANQLLADAAGYASTGQTQNDAQAGLLGRINRGIDDQEEQYMLNANFGGFNPGSGADYFNRQRTDAPQTAFEQALAQAAGLTAGLGGGLEFAQKAADSATGAFNSSSSIAAQQAAAANGLRTQANLNNADNRATGISTGGAALGTGIANAGLSWQPGASQPGASTPTTNGLYQPNFNPYQNIKITGQSG